MDFYVSCNGNDKWSGRRSAPDRGRTDGPFATLARAQRAVREMFAAGGVKEPVRVVLRGGTYALEAPLVFGPEDSGRSQDGAPLHVQIASPKTVSYESYPGETPVLSGGRRIDGWKPARVNGRAAWVADLPDVRNGRWTFTQLWVNGSRAARTRLPKQGLFRIETLRGRVDWDEPRAMFTGQDEFDFAAGDLKAWRNLCDIEFVALHFWIESRLPFAEIDEAARVARLQWKPRMRLTDDFNRLGAPYYVENLFEALDAPGQWYLDRPAGRLYYLPRPGEKPSRTEVIAPCLAALVELRGDAAQDRWVEHLAFKGLTFAHAEWTPGPEALKATPQAACHLPGMLTFSGARHLRVEGCTVEHGSVYGIEVRGGSWDVDLTHNTIRDIAGGVKVWHEAAPGAVASPGSGPDQSRSGTCRCVRIADNEIADGGHRHHQAVGVLVGRCSGIEILHNHIHDFDYSGVSVGWVWGYADGDAYGNIIEYNHIHDIGRVVLSDMGGIYTLSPQPGTRIRFNVIHDVDSRGYGGWGIYPDEGSSRLLIENNLVYRTKCAGFHQHYGRDNVVRNNIFAFGREAGLHRSRLETHSSFAFERNILLFDNDSGQALAGEWKAMGATVDRNLYFHLDGKPLKFGELTWREWRALGAEACGRVADPGFRNPRKGDFHLKPGSPALDLGFVPFDLSTVGPRAAPAGGASGDHDIG